MRAEKEIFADAAEKRPFSNHSEYEYWAAEWCYRCVHDDGETEKWCPILSVALLGKWPAEWTRHLHRWQSGDACGEYEAVDTCTEFEERRDDGDDPPDPPPPPVHDLVPGQVDIFEVLADQAAEEFQKQREPVAA